MRTEEQREHAEIGRETVEDIRQVAEEMRQTVELLCEVTGEEKPESAGDRFEQLEERICRLEERVYEIEDQLLRAGADLRHTAVIGALNNAENSQQARYPSCRSENDRDSMTCRWDSRCCVDNRTATLLQHLRNFVLHAQPDASEIDGKHPVPIVLWELGGGRIRMLGHPGIVVRTVKSAIGLDRLGEQRFHCSGLCDIGLHKHCFPTIFRDEVHGLYSTVLVHIGDDQFGPFPGKGQRGGSADA